MNICMASDQGMEAAPKEQQSLGGQTTPLMRKITYNYGGCTLEQK
jgi:hypothetical protein